MPLWQLFGQLVHGSIGVAQPNAEPVGGGERGQGDVCEHAMERRGQRGGLAATRGDAASCVRQVAVEALAGVPAAVECVDGDAGSGNTSNWEAPDVIR